MNSKLSTMSVLLVSVTSIVMSSTVGAAVNCKSVVSVTAAKGDVVNRIGALNGYTLVKQDNGIAIFHPTRGTRVVSLSEADYKLLTLQRVSGDQVVATVLEPAIYGKQGRENNVYKVQIMRLTQDGELQAVQEIKTQNVGQRVEDVVVLNQDTLVITVDNGMNQPSDALVYARQGQGALKKVDQLKGIDYLSGIQMKDQQSGLLVSRKDNRDQLLTIENSRIVKIPVLKADGDSRIKIMNAKLGLAVVTKNNKSGSSEFFQDMSLVQVKGQKAQVLGTLAAEKKQGLFNVARSAEASDTGIVVYDSWSASYGINNSMMLNDQVNFVSVVNGKMKVKTTIVNDGVSVSQNDSRATLKKLSVLSDQESLLVGNGLIQVMRDGKVAEVINFKSNLHFDRAEVVRVSATRFIVQDLFVLDRMIENSTYKSQLHVFDLVNGKYVQVGSKELEGRRFNSTTVLDSNTIQVDVRSGDGKTANLIDINLNNLR